MTFSKRFASKKLLVGGIAALALSLSTGAFASVSAMGGNGHGANPPVVASQCDHPGYRHFGFSSKKDCADYVNGHNKPGQGQGSQGHGSGYGGNGNGNSQNIFVSIGNVVNGAVNITINFVTNIFK